MGSGPIPARWLRQCAAAGAITAKVQPSGRSLLADPSWVDRGRSAAAPGMPSRESGIGTSRRKSSASRSERIAWLARWQAIQQFRPSIEATRPACPISLTSRPGPSADETALNGYERAKNYLVSRNFTPAERERSERVLLDIIDECGPVVEGYPTWQHPQGREPMNQD